MLARGWLAYPVTPTHHPSTAEERFHTLARGWLAYPVTPTHHTSTAEERLYKRHPSVCLVAERRHSSVTRYAKRSVACRDSPRHQPLRAGGTPLPRHRRLPHPIVRHHHRIAPPGAMYHKKTAEERFHMLARGWLAYPVTSIHSHLPPKSGCICQHIPRFANPMPPHTIQVFYQACFLNDS